MASPKRELEEVREAALELPGVVGVGRGDGTIIVFTRKSNPAAVERIAQAVTTPVVENVIGDPKAAVPELRTGGPFAHGCNVAFPATDGTDAYIVSAYHCVSDLTVGDRVSAAGRDIGEISHHPDVRDIDAGAVTAYVDGDWVAVRMDNAQPIRDIERLDKPLSGAYYDAPIGDTLVKEGDRTGVSSGRVFAKDVSVVAPADISGYGQRIRVDSLTGMNTTVSPGDSGGPVMKEMDDHYRPVGTVYGGTPHTTLFFTDMGHVAEQTGLSFDGPIPQVADGGDGTILGGDPEPPTGEVGPSGLQVAAGLTLLVGAGLGLAALRDHYERRKGRSP